MSPRFSTQKLIQNVILSLLFAVSSIQSTFGVSPKQPLALDDVRQVLLENGFTDFESQHMIDVLKKRDRPYSTQQLKDFLAWLEKHGIRDTKRLSFYFQRFVPLLIKTNQNATFAELEATLIELKDHWGITIEEIAKSPDLLTARRSRLQKLRALLYKIAELAGDTQFLLSDFTISKRLDLIRYISTEQLIQRFKTIGAILPERQDLFHLNASEQKKIIILYEKGELEALFARPVDLSSKKLDRLARLINDNPLPEPKIKRAASIRAAVNNFVNGPKQQNNREILLAVLKTEGFTDTEIAKVAHVFSKQPLPPNFKAVIEWLNQKKFKDVKKLILSQPLVLTLSVKSNLEPKFNELKTHWGLGTTEIERSPDILKASLTRIQELRSLLEGIAKLAGDTQFEFGYENREQTVSQRLFLIKRISANQIIQKLKGIGAIRPKKQDLLNLTAAEKDALTELYRQHKLQDLLTRGAELKPTTARKLSQFVNSEIMQVALKKDNFTDSEIKRILQNVDNAYSVEDYKNYVKWLKKQGIEDTKTFIASTPEILRYPPEHKRAPKLVELIAHWGYKLSDIENSTDFMRMNLERVQSTRKFFDQIANLANVPHFDLNELSLPQKRILITENISSDELLDRLKDVIGPENRKKKKKLSDFSDSEKALVAEFYKTKRDKLIDVLARKTRIPFIKSTEISCELRFLRQKLQVQ